MPVVKTCGATKKLGPICFGRRVVSFKLGKIKRQFTVHEDLICATSEDFRHELQENRKEVEGDCSICHEDVNDDAGDLMFCRSQCGQNFHGHCIDNWIRSQHGRAKCPMCRHTLQQNLHTSTQLYEDADVSEQAVETYCNWLYTGQVQVDHGVSRRSEVFRIHILKAWYLSDLIGDKTFQRALVANYITENKFGKGFWIASMKYAFGGAASDELKSFVIHNFLRVADLELYRKEIFKFPVSFKEELSLWLLEEEPIQPSLEDILENFTDGAYELEE